MLGKNLFALQGVKDRAAAKGVDPNALTYARHSDNDAIRNDWEASFYGKGGTTPLDQFQINDNTKYAKNMIGWGEAQKRRQAAEAADALNPQPPPTGGNKWDRRYNYVTNEMEWTPRNESNFWKANQNELLTMAAFAAGGIGGLVPGLIASAAKTGYDIHKTRQARREFKDDKRDWEYQQAQAQADAARYGPQSGNLFKNIGEGTVEWATKDVERNKRKGTYERGAV